MSEEITRLDQYPAHGVASAEAALVKAWSALENFHEDLVVVGGLAIYAHTKETVNPLYRPAGTLDVDMGIALGADAGMAAPARFALEQAGFQEDKDKRMVLQMEQGKLYLDFLSEHPPQESGTRNVSELTTSVCPGINRALENPIKREISGSDLHGDHRTFQIPFCNYGPLLVLKLNAFAKREGPKRGKDAYDVLSLVQSCPEGPKVAIAGFAEEKQSENAGMELAMQTLQEYFTDADQLGPELAAEFYQGVGISAELSQRLREDLVTVAQALLGI